MVTTPPLYQKRRIIAGHESACAILFCYFSSSRSLQLLNIPEAFLVFFYSIIIFVLLTSVAFPALFDELARCKRYLPDAAAEETEIVEHQLIALSSI
jgi:hypothetical protein